MSREPYTFLVLRYRHDVMTGEALNVGVVLHCKSAQFLGAQFRKAYGRISKAFPDVDGAALRRDLSAIERAFERLARREGDDMFFADNDVVSLARRIVGREDGSLVWSDPGSGVTKDPAKALQTLYDRYVTRYEDRPASRRTDDDVWKPFRDKLLELQIADIFEKKTIISSNDEVEFEHAWKNGKWHVYEPLSFDLLHPSSIQEKAARWVGHMHGLKDQGDEFRPHFIVGAPSDPSLVTAYERAVKFLKTSPLRPTIIEEDKQFAAAIDLSRKVRDHRWASLRADEPGFPQLPPTVRSVENKAEAPLLLGFQSLTPQRSDLPALPSPKSKPKADK